jgi:hypothetical protein
MRRKMGGHERLRDSWLDVCIGEDLVTAEDASAAHVLVACLARTRL